jgi:hypothetical protein
MVEEETNEEAFSLKEVGNVFEQYTAKIQESVSNFNSLLDSISSTEDRKKILWKEIYYNAIIDRRNAFMMYAELTSQIQRDPTQHAVLGTHVSKYLERMSKANDQLIKLAEIVDSKIELINGQTTSNDNILDVIQNEENAKKKKR